ncbi:beta-1,4-galactosyltransferase galt-1-like [Anneissia japonica]|uniref:beta-1,4-galactosyltransferase galt-1-like n=1 Tax=Anneissia japonica TaxID=1529436 RepID=UPI00142566E9|nr:beta-1,4-galactosyltransferase galt-1-like [Anneissia japonica]
MFLPIAKRCRPSFKNFIVLLGILCNIQLFAWLISYEAVFRNLHLKAYFGSKTNERKFPVIDDHMPQHQNCSCLVPNSDAESCFFENRLECDCMPTINSVFADYTENRVVFIGITFFGKKWSAESFLCEFPNGDKTVTDPIVKDSRSFGIIPQYALVITCPFPADFSNSSAFSERRFNINLRRKKLPSVAYAKIPICASHKKFGLTEEKKHSLIICTMTKDMDGFFPMWLDYHRHVGVDHIYIYDNSRRGSLPNSLSRYTADGFVSIIPWAHVYTPWKNFTEVQIPQENDCIWRNKHKSKWVLSIDVDEFIQPMDPDKPYIKDYIKNFNFTNIGCFKIHNWYFGSRFYKSNSTSVIEHNRWRIKSPTLINIGHDKCIIQPENVHYFKTHQIKLGGDTLTLDPYKELRLVHYRASNPRHKRGPKYFQLNYNVKDLSMLKIWKKIHGCHRRDIECQEL